MQGGTLMKWTSLLRIFPGIIFVLILLSGYAAAEQKYKVQNGDTLSSIAEKKGVTISALKAINNLKKNNLKIDQTLIIPFAKEQPEVESEFANVNIPQPSDLSNINEEVIGDNAKKELLGVWSTPAERQMLVKVALAFLGAPYRLGGSSVKGIDCSGYVKKIYALFGINLPRTAAEQSHVGVEVAKSNLTEGDLIFFNTNNRISHVGIYIGDNEFIHAASKNKGVRIDNLDSSYYKNHYKRAVRLKASDDAT